MVVSNTTNLATLKQTVNKKVDRGKDGRIGGYNDQMMDEWEIG